MKGFISVIFVGVAAGLGISAGMDLWDNVLSDKFENLVSKTRKES